MMHQKEDCKQYNDYFDLMISEIDRANSIMTEFLALSKDKATEFKACRLDEIVNQLLSAHHGRCPSIDINVRGQVEEKNSSPALEASENPQVISNLEGMALEGPMRREAF